MRARTKNVVVRDVDDEIVVVDLDTDEAHLLSSRTSLVWNAADGRPVESLFTLFIDEEPAVREQLVWEALGRLADARLLATPIQLPTAGLTRRALLQRLGVAVIAIPAITTIVMADPAAAAFTCAGPCTAQSNCAGNTDPTGCRCPILKVGNNYVTGGTCSACIPSGSKPGGNQNCDPGNQANCCSGACSGSGNNSCS